jgi:hypothetical protein
MRNRPVRAVSLAVLAVVGAASLALGSQGVASADPPGQVTSCQNTPNREYSNQGQCTSTLETYTISNGNTQDTVGTCNLYFAHVGGGVPGGPYSSMGDCVSGLKALGY